jgi:hypothetical protein
MHLALPKVLCGGQCTRWVVPCLFCLWGCTSIMQSLTLQLYSYPFSLPLASERSSLPASPYPMNDPCHTTSFVKSLLSYFGPSHIPPPWEPHTTPHTFSLGWKLNLCLWWHYPWETMRLRPMPLDFFTIIYSETPMFSSLVGHARSHAGSK